MNSDSTPVSTPVDAIEQFPTPEVPIEEVSTPIVALRNNWHDNYSYNAESVTHVPRRIPMPATELDPRETREMFAFRQEPEEPTTTEVVEDFLTDAIDGPDVGNLFGDEEPVRVKPYSTHTRYSIGNLSETIRTLGPRVSASSGYINDKIVSALFESVRLSEWRQSKTDENVWQIPTTDELWYVEVTSEAITLCKGLRRINLSTPEYADSLYQAIKHAREMVVLNIAHREVWEDPLIHEDLTPESLACQLIAEEAEVPVISSVADLAAALNKYIAEGWIGEEDSNPYLLVPILKTIMASKELKEWKFIAPDKMFQLWTENDEFLVRVSEFNVSFYKGATPFPVATDKNAAQVFDHFGGQSTAVVEEEDDPENESDLFGMVISAMSEEVVGVQPVEPTIEGSVDFTDCYKTMDNYVAESFEEVYANATPRPLPETPAGLAKPAVEVLVEEPMKNEEKPKLEPKDEPKKYAHEVPESESFKQTQITGTQQYLKSVQGRVLTIMEAAFPDKEQREAIKTLVKKEFRREMDRVHRNVTFNEGESDDQI